MEANDLDIPITLEHHTFVEYAFKHWLDSLKKGVPSRTLCLLGPPGIGKSSAAKDIAKRQTDYVRANPQLIFGVGTVKEALVLMEQDRNAQIKTKLRFQYAMDDKFSQEQLDALIELVQSEQKPFTQEDIKAVAELLDFSSKLPEDLGGLPFRAEDGFVDYCPQRWVARLCAKFSFGVYVEDDLAAAAQAMQTAGRQSALERRIHENKFAPGILVMVTGNRREDRSAASTLPAHFRNSICLLAIEPSVEEWKKWYGKQKGCDPIVAAFLTWKPEHLSQLPKDADKMGAFATPRQWFSLGQQFSTAKECGDEVLLAISAGLVGKGVALDFNAFVEIRNTLVDPEKVFEDPENALPNPCDKLDEPSKCIAMVCALGEIAAHRWKRGKGVVKNKAPEKLIRALAWVCAAGDEYSAVGVQTFLDNGGNLTALARVARDCRGDVVIGRLLDHVKSALLGE
jgi:hypothetical protein